MVHVSAVMMLKNEEKRLHVTLASLVNVVNSLIIYDTGSTDSTIDILETFSKTHGIPLYLKRGDFVDFATSRNVLLDFADEVAKDHRVQYLLLLDCNDELRGGKELLSFCKDNLYTDETAWLFNQEWFSGSYLNIIIFDCFDLERDGSITE